jgi:hypothetical protein
MKTIMKPCISELYSILLGVEESIPGVVYKFTKDENFQEIDNISESQLVYWSEIIQRLHACSATTLLRLKKWIEAIQIAFEQKNYYGFCASSRGLIEACSDSFYTLGSVIYPIAENFKYIKIATKGESTKIILSESIENHLIHYLYARKLTRPEKDAFPDSHNAIDVREYLKSINDENAIKLYAELCQVSHPSTMSLIPFLIENDEYGLTLHKKQIDDILNRNILDRHRETIYNSTMHALATSLCGLKMVNYFDVPLFESLHTDEKAFISLEGYPLWLSIEEKINNSFKGNLLGSGL